ncbi:hypothetical protein ACIBCH_15820 [Amycolatopsis thailandensis]|uniref:hypothetical protein n=1 Tax=Amycolatopsis thailandensis TaxID=589330 RepID=UPI0037AF07A6
MITIAVVHIAARVNSGSRFTEDGAGPGAEEALAAAGRASSVMSRTSRKPARTLHTH